MNSNPVNNHLTSMSGNQAPDFDLQLFEYHNQVRQTPTVMIPELERMLTWFEGDTNIMAEPGAVRLMTQEGKSVILELIEFLKVQ